jgi:hypothetical protein
MALPKNLHDFNLAELKFEEKIRSKPEKKPQFSVIYGKGGIGKTTLASYSQDPIIIPVGRETGVEKMAVPKFPNYEEMNLSITDHVFACLSWLIKAEHTRKTVIIDNAGAYREGVDYDVEDSNKGVDLKAFGKAQSLAYPYWTTLLSSIDGLMKKRDMNVILIGHDSSYNVNLPDGNYYQRISINTPRGENTNVTGLIEARCHNMFYMTNESATSKVKDKFGQSKIIATGSITRTIYTKPSGQFFAKSRVNLEEYYDIGNSSTEEDLLHLRNNQEIIDFWESVYR